LSHWVELLVPLHVPVENLGRIWHPEQFEVPLQSGLVDRTRRIWTSTATF
jgi:hypothetical protein